MEQRCTVCKSRLRYVDKVGEWYCDTCKTFPMTQKDRKFISTIVIIFVVLIAITIVAAAIYPTLLPHNTGNLRVIYLLLQQKDL